MPDPTSYELWCYDDIWHWMGQTRNGNRGDPPSKDGVPVYVDTLVYSPTEISDFAESGNWLNLPPGGFLDVTGICGPYTYRNSVHNANGVIIGGEAPGFDPYRKDTQYPNESSGRLSVCLSVAGAVQVNKDMPHSWYWGFSPENDFTSTATPCMSPSATPGTPASTRRARMDCAAAGGIPHLPITRRPTTS